MNSLQVWRQGTRYPGRRLAVGGVLENWSLESLQPYMYGYTRFGCSIAVKARCRYAAVEVEVR